MSDVVVNVVRVGFLVAVYLFLFFVARAVSRHLASEPRTRPASPEAPPAPGVTLLVTSGWSEPRVVEIRGKMVVGRSPEADVTLDDEFASGRHARFEVVEGALFVEDLGSRNGTLVNGRPAKERTRLASGDVVRIGETEMEAR